MNIDWRELPKDAVCITAYDDYSGLQLCYIHPKKGLCDFDGGEEICLVRHQLLAINPSVSPKEFGRAMQICDYNQIKILNAKINKLEGKQ